jgi:hypothetical protein
MLTVSSLTAAKRVLDFLGLKEEGDRFEAWSLLHDIRTKSCQHYLRPYFYSHRPMLHVVKAYFSIFFKKN